MSEKAVTESHPSDRLRELATKWTEIARRRSIEAEQLRRQGEPERADRLEALADEGHEHAHQLSAVRASQPSEGESDAQQEGETSAQRVVLSDRIHVGADVGGGILPGVADKPVGPSEGWQDISTAPKDGTRLLMVNPESGSVRIAWYDEPHESWSYSGVWPPTHWQPLPAPPSLVRVIAETTRAYTPSELDNELDVRDAELAALAETTREGSKTEDLAHVAPLGSSTDRISAETATGDK